MVGSGAWNSESACAPIATLPPDAPAVIRSVIVRGEYAFVTNSGGTEPRLYDLRTAAVAWKSDVALAATFWPKPATE